MVTVRKSVDSIILRKLLEIDVLRAVPRNSGWLNDSTDRPMIPVLEDLVYFCIVQIGRNVLHFKSNSILRISIETFSLNKSNSSSRIGIEIFDLNRKSNSLSRSGMFIKTNSSYRISNKSNSSLEIGIEIFNFNYEFNSIFRIDIINFDYNIVGNVRNYLNSRIRIKDEINNFTNLIHIAYPCTQSLGLVIILIDDQLFI